MDICSSPQLIAAYHVFRRLLVPRHPPYALFCLTSRLILQSPLICSVISIGLFVIIYFVNGYNISLTFVSVWILWLDVLLIINGYLLSLSVWCFQGTFWLLTQSYDPGSFLRSDHCSVSFWSGGHLFSHTVSSAVPSAAYVLTVVFGMGTGVSHKRIATRSLLLSLDN